MVRIFMLLRVWLIASIAIAVFGVSSVVWSAPVPRTENGVAYVSGGIGKGPQQSMQAMRNSYNLHVTFARKGTGDYLSDVKVVILDSIGKELVSAISEGPFFFAKLAPGKYSVSADYHGSKQVRPVDVEDNKTVSLYLYWMQQ